MAQQMSVQDYLVKYFPVFWKSLTGKVVAEKDCLNECLYHSDKASQYWSLWADAGIHPFNGTMLYLLTHEAPWYNECRRDFPHPNGIDRHWFGPCDWVIANYERFKEHLPHPVNYLKQTKVRITNPDGSIAQRGNCMATTLAIMTKRSIDEVPALETMGEGWHVPLFKWLKEIGYKYTATQNPSGLLIANGMSCRGIAHSVITIDGKFFHDPHPNDSYLESISQFWRVEPITDNKDIYVGNRELDRKEASTQLIYVECQPSNVTELVQRKSRSESSCSDIVLNFKQPMLENNNG